MTDSGRSPEQKRTAPPFRIVVAALLLIVGACTTPALAQNASETDATPEAVDQAIDQMSRLNYAGAADRLEGHLKTKPENARAWYLLGLCRNRLGIYEEAYAALTNATSFGASTPALHRELGFALQGMNRRGAALIHLRKAGENDADAWLARGQILLHQKKYEQAKPALRKVIQLDTPLTSSAHLLLARILSVQGDVALAREQLEKGLRRTKRSEMKSAYKSMGRLLEVLDEQVLKLYNGIFYREVVNKDEGVIEKRRRDDELRTHLSDAFSAYRDQTAEENRSPADFRSFVRSDEEWNRADRLLANLKELFRQLDTLELSDKQTNNLELMMARSITPEAMTTDFLVDTIQAGEAR